MRPAVPACNALYFRCVINRGGGDGKQLLSPRPLKEWEARLPASFARVHRTAIVNLDHVERVERTSDDAFAVYVRGVPVPVPLSRRHAARLRSLG